MKHFQGVIVAFMTITPLTFAKNVVYDTQTFQPSQLAVQLASELAAQLVLQPAVRQAATLR